MRVTTARHGNRVVSPVDGKVIPEFFSSFDYMNTGTLYESKFKTLIGNINSLISQWQSYTSQVSPQATGSEYDTTVQPLITRLKADINDLAELKKQLDTEIETKVSKLNHISQQTNKLLTENTNLEAEQNPESTANQTAKGLYQEERNLYNLKLVEVVLYVAAISFMAYTLNS